jgi:hypothetical protein
MGIGGSGASAAIRCSLYTSTAVFASPLVMSDDLDEEDPDAAQEDPDVAKEEDSWNQNGSLIEEEPNPQSGWE